MDGAPPTARKMGGAFAHLDPLQLSSRALPPKRGMGVHTPGRPYPPPMRSSDALDGSPIKPKGAGGAQGGSDPELRDAMLALLNSQEAMVAKASGPLQGLAMSGGDDVGGVRLPRARGAVALEIYRAELLQNPQAWSQRIRSNAQRAVSESSDAAAAPPIMEFLLRYMPWGKAGRGVTYLGFLIGHSLDCMHRGEWLRGEALLYLGLVSLEQSLHDSGRWGMAWLLTHFPEPPWHVFQQGMQPDSLRPIGRLADPDWTAAAMAYVRDAAGLSELQKKGPGGCPDPKAKDEATPP